MTHFDAAYVAKCYLNEAAKHFHVRGVNVLGESR